MTGSNNLGAELPSRTLFFPLAKCCILPMACRASNCGIYRPEYDMIRGSVSKTVRFLIR